MASVPKRESSKRRAKDTAKRSNQVINTGDDDEDIQDIELEDSDDDASWTPFKVSLMFQHVNPLRYMISVHDNSKKINLSD